MNKYKLIFWMKSSQEDDWSFNIECDDPRSIRTVIKAIKSQGFVLANVMKQEKEWLDCSEFDSLF